MPGLVLRARNSVIGYEESLRSGLGGAGGVLLCSQSLESLRARWSIWISLESGFVYLGRNGENGSTQFQALSLAKFT